MTRPIDKIEYAIRRWRGEAVAWYDFATGGWIPAINDGNATVEDQAIASERMAAATKRPGDVLRLIKIISYTPLTSEERRAMMVLS